MMNNDTIVKVLVLILLIILAFLILKLVCGNLQNVKVGINNGDSSNLSPVSGGAKDPDNYQMLKSTLDNLLRDNVNKWSTLEVTKGESDIHKTRLDVIIRDTQDSLITLQNKLLETEKKPRDIFDINEAADLAAFKAVHVRLRENAKYIKNIVEEIQLMLTGWKYSNPNDRIKRSNREIIDLLPQVNSEFDEGLKKRLQGYVDSLERDILSNGYLHKYLNAVSEDIKYDADGEVNVSKNVNKNVNKNAFVPRLGNNDNTLSGPTEEVLRLEQDSDIINTAAGAFTPTWDKLHKIAVQENEYPDEYIDKVKFVILERIKNEQPQLHPQVEKLDPVDKKLADNIGGVNEQKQLEFLLNDFLDEKGITPRRTNYNSGVQRFMKYLAETPATSPAHKLVTAHELNEIETTFERVKKTI